MDRDIIVDTSEGNLSDSSKRYGDLTAYLYFMIVSSFYYMFYLSADWVRVKSAEQRKRSTRAQDARLRLVVLLVLTSTKKNWNAMVPEISSFTNPCQSFKIWTY